MIWWVVAAAAGIVAIVVLDRVIASRRKDYVSKGWVADHQTSEGHQDRWLAGRNR